MCFRRLNIDKADISIARNSHRDRHDVVSGGCDVSNRWNRLRTFHSRICPWPFPCRHLLTANFYREVRTEARHGSSLCAPRQAMRLTGGGGDDSRPAIGPVERNAPTLCAIMIRRNPRRDSFRSFVAESPDFFSSLRGRRPKNAT